LLELLERAAKKNTPYSRNLLEFSMAVFGRSRRTYSLLRKYLNNALPPTPIVSRQLNKKLRKENEENIKHESNNIHNEDDEDTGKGEEAMEDSSTPFEKGETQETSILITVLPEKNGLGSEAEEGIESLADFETQNDYTWTPMDSKNSEPRVFNSPPSRNRRIHVNIKSEGTEEPKPLRRAPMTAIEKLLSGNYCDFRRRAKKPAKVASNPFTDRMKRWKETSKPIESDVSSVGPMNDEDILGQENRDPTTEPKR